MSWREAHRRRVDELENEATFVLLGALAPILSDVAGQFAVVAVTADAGDAEARASVDDLAAIQTQWTQAVDQVVVPYFETVFVAGADAAVDQVAALRGTIQAVPAADPELLAHAADQYLAQTRNRFYPLGESAWTQARDGILAGFRDGDGIDALRSRITDVVDLTAREAELLARTEVIGASNMGAQARIDLMGDDAPPFRQWLATMDARTRPTHMAADGQVVPRGTPFEVGSARLMVPGDPSGPGAEVINCRCTVLYTDTADALVAEGRQEGGIVDDVALAAGAYRQRHGLPGDVVVAAPPHLVDLARATTDTPVVAAAGPPQVDTTTGEPHTGAMIALIPADPEEWTVPAGEPADAIHLTLGYLGEGDDIPDPVFDTLLAEIETLAGQLGPITGRVFGAAVWNASGDSPCLVLNVGDDPASGRALQEVHLAARAAVAAASDGAWAPPDNHSPWVAHMCMRYGLSGDPTAVAAAMEGPVNFDRIRLTRGPDAYDFELAGAQPEEDDDAMNRADVTAQIEAAMAAAVEKARADLGLGPGEPLTININLAAAIDDEPPAPSGTPGDEDEDGPPAQPGEHLRAVMHMQGTATGQNDTGRVFTNLTYRTTPFAYHVQVNSSAHGGTPKVVPVGLVTRVVEEGDTHYGFVRLDLDSPDGAEHARRVVAGFDRWVSIGADETKATVTLVWPPPSEMPDPGEMLEEGQPIEETLIEPERVIIDGAHVAELTGVSTPAQADATLEPTQELLDMLGGAVDVTVGELLEAGHLVAASGHLDDDTVVRMEAPVVSDPLPPFQVRRGGVRPVTYTIPRPSPEFAFGGIVTRAAGVQVHAGETVDPHGCGCGGSCGTCGSDNPAPDSTPWADPASDPLGDVRAMVASTERRSREAAVLTAAAHTITLPELPPAAWFQEPTDVDVDGAFCVTDEGRIYGLLAPFGTGHRAWAASGGRREAPRGNVDYAGFMGGWALTAEGKVHAGPLTMDCGHAAIHRADHQVAKEHYDNTCSVIGAVAVGESDRLGGVWIAGAILPGTKPEQIARALACRCSGDWQPHPDNAGQSELIACLLVPSPGFRSEHATTSYRGEALVASSVPVRHVPTAEIEAAHRRAAGVLAVARLTGRTPAARVMTALKVEG